MANKNELKIISTLDYFLNEIILDMIEVTPDYPCYLFSLKKEDGEHFEDYELKTDFALPIPEPVPLVNELKHTTSLKEVAKIICELRYPKYSSSQIVLMVAIISNNCTPYKLAKLLGISKQAVSQFLKGEVALPQRRKEQIAQLFSFDVKEFDNTNRTKLIFNESDL